MEQILATHLITVARAFASARGYGLGTVGKLMAGDGRFFDRIDNIATGAAPDGPTFNARTYDRLMGKFSDNWPEGAAWPEGVERPQPAEAQP